MTDIATKIAAVAARIREGGMPEFLNRWASMTPDQYVAMEDRRAMIVAALHKGDYAMNAAKIGPREQALRDMRAEDTPLNLPKEPKGPKAALKRFAQTTDQALAAAQGRGVDAVFLGTDLPPAKAAAKPPAPPAAKETAVNATMNTEATTKAPAAKRGAKKAAKKAATPARKAKGATKHAKAAKAPKAAQKRASVDRSPMTVGTYIAEAGAVGRAMADVEKKFDMDAHPLRAKIFAARHELGFKIDYDAKTKRYVGTPPKSAA